LAVESTALIFMTQTGCFVSFNRSTCVSCS